MATERTPTESTPTESTASESTATGSTATGPLDLDLIEEASDAGSVPLAYGAVQVAGLNGVSYRIASDDIVDLSIHNGPAGNSRITLRGPVAELKVVVAMMDGALDRARREMGPVALPECR